MENITFLELFRLFITYHSNTDNTFDKRSSNTLRNYSIRYLKVSSFLYYKGLTNLLAKDFTISLAKDFFAFTLRIGHKHNTCVRHVYICSQVLDFGAANEIIPANPISAYKLKKTPPQPPPFYTPEQIKLWEDYHTSSSEKRKAADMFLIQMHTGFDYGDFSTLQPDHIHIIDGCKYIVKPRNKNGNEAVIPLSELCETLIYAYNFRLCALSNPVYNRSIKEIAVELGLPPVKSQDARKIFLGNKLNNECYSLEATSRMAGHRSVTTTEAYYVRVNIDRIHSEVLSRRRL